MAISTTEKLAITGAFLAIVAMGVGTEEDPGVVAAPAMEAAALQPEPPPPAAPESRAADVGETTASRWWPDFGGGVSRGAREAAEADRRGSVGVDKAPEPPPNNF